MMDFPSASGERVRARDNLLISYYDPCPKSYMEHIYRQLLFLSRHFFEEKYSRPYIPGARLEIRTRATRPANCRE